MKRIGILFPYIDGKSLPSNCILSSFVIFVGRLLCLFVDSNIMAVGDRNTSRQLLAPIWGVRVTQKDTYIILGDIAAPLARNSHVFSGSPAVMKELAVWQPRELSRDAWLTCPPQLAAGVRFDVGSAFPLPLTDMDQPSRSPAPPVIAAGITVLFFQQLRCVY